MFNLLKNVIDSTGITTKSFLICLLIALISGLIISTTCYAVEKLSKGFLTSLLLLPAIVSTLLLLINSNIGTGIAIAGAFSLVRFRSVAGKAKDIILVFLAMTVGLACSTGYIFIALLLTILVSVVIIILSKVKLYKENEQELRITIPENLNYQNEFNDLFKEYTNSYKLFKVKTSNMGSLYKLEYRISLKDPSNTQEFMNKLRARNGNLEIMISDIVEGENEL